MIGNDCNYKEILREILFNILVGVYIPIYKHPFRKNFIKLILCNITKKNTYLPT